MRVIAQCKFSAVTNSTGHILAPCSAFGCSTVRRIINNLRGYPPCVDEYKRAWCPSVNPLVGGSNPSRGANPKNLK